MSTALVGQTCFQTDLFAGRIELHHDGLLWIDAILEGDELRPHVGFTQLFEEHTKVDLVRVLTVVVGRHRLRGGTNGTHHIGRGGLNWSLLVKGLQLGVFTQAA